VFTKPEHNEAWVCLENTERTVAVVVHVKISGTIRKRSGMVWWMEKQLKTPLGV
jgi:hypothetical protein